VAALAQALAAPPSVVLIEGEAGIGKTRLVREFLASSTGKRGKTLVMLCPPLRQPLTLGPVVDALRQGAGDVRRLELSALAGSLRPLFPEWGAVLPPAPEPLDDAAAARHRVFSALAELLARLGTGVLVIEDAHWADEATLEFLLFLTTGQVPPVSLVLTSRPEDVPVGSLLLRLSRLAAGSSGLRLILGPLDVAQTATLVSSMLAGEHVTEQFALFLHAHTDGLPLAIEESVRLMGDRADLTFRHGAWARRHLDAIAVPPTVRDAVLERAGRLSSGALAVLRAAAVLGQPAAESVLTVVAGVSADAARTGVCEALDCGLLIEDSPGGQGLVFRHALAARAVYEAILVPLRREMHLRAGLALAERPPLPLAQLARHFREAGDTAAWCEYGEQAARFALEAGDVNAASLLLQDLVVHAGLAAGVVARLARRVQIMALSGYAAAGDIAHALRSGLDSGTLTSAQRAEVGWILGMLLADVGDWEAAASELTRAIPGLTHRPVEAARAMTLLGWPCQGLWPAHEHRRWLDQATVIASHPSFPESDRLKFLGDRTAALLKLGEDEGWTAIPQLPEDAETAGNALVLAVASLNVGEAAIPWGRYRQARELLARSLRLAEQYEHPRVRDCALVALAHLDWFTGDWEGLASRAGELTGLTDAEPLLPVEASLVAGLLGMATGVAESAEPRLRFALTEHTRRGNMIEIHEPAAALAKLLLSSGRIAEAVDVTEHPVEVIAAKGIWIWATEIVPIRVRALTVSSKSEEAAKLVDAFTHGLRGRTAPAPQAALLLCAALLAEAAGQHGDAAAVFGRAADAWLALPRPHEALLAREHQARCLIAGGHAETGLPLLATVRQELARLGAVGDASRVAAVLRGHGVVRGGRRGRRGYGDQLSPRELEVVRLLAQGQTDREIAASLVVTPKTVAYHLDSARRKLRAHSRTALLVAAFSAGIIPKSVVEATDIQPQH
jgi:DNA-binding CsgD family transcriptional regulator